MPRPRLSPEERKERRREAALKGIAARAAKQEIATAPAEPQAPPARELIARAQALGIRREADFWRRVHELRIGQRPGRWNPRARLALAAALAIWEAKP
jgi:hypothetical protein